jgi:hypothetical protein
MGGLGNQLFQIFCVMAYAIENQTQFIFPYDEKLTTGMIRPTYWNTFLSRLLPYTTFSPESIYKNHQLFQFPKYNEKRYFEYQPIPRFSAENRVFVGYFQSYKYFEKYADQIIEFIGIREFQASMRERNTGLFSGCGEIVGMHFRLGDYVTKQEYHPVMSYEYYERAIARVRAATESPLTVLYFCENENNEAVEYKVAKLREQYPTVIFVKADDDISDWEQLILMSCCHHQIIANSTFSWWAAYLNTNKDKMVCCPSKWVGVKMQEYSVHDLIPPSWILL